MKLLRLVLMSAAMSLVFVASTPRLFAQVATPAQESSLRRLNQSIADVPHSDARPIRWSMIGVGGVLVFFRLRRKHQVTFSSTRLTHGLHWNARSDAG